MDHTLIRKFSKENPVGFVNDAEICPMVPREERLPLAIQSMEEVKMSEDEEIGR